jgi:L-rhamnose 1-dehydrogenase
MTALLVGKTAAITGAVTGIGRAIAAEYLRHGAAVVVNHLNDDESHAHFATLKREAPDPAKLHAVAGNISEREVGQGILRAAVEQFGGIDVFVANAGVSQFRDFLTYAGCLDDTIKY